MKAGKLLLIGGTAAALVLVLVGAASASSSKPTGNTPPPPRPGPGATFENLPAGLGESIPALKRTSWRVAADASGQQAGLMILVQAAASPDRDWVLLFKDDQRGVGILGYSQTPMAGLIAQQLAAGF